jgi:pimeloyl-ACP methyl ester carboxylesterase
VSTFVLIPGAGGVAWYWHRVVPLLRAAGHDAVAVDLPGDDDQAGLPEYADLVIDAIGGRSDVVLVAQSLGGFTAPLVASRVGLRALVFVNAMVPAPGERPRDWWGATGAAAARKPASTETGHGGDFDPHFHFLHDVPADVVEASAPHQRPEAEAAFDSVCAFERWPDIPIRAAAGADDRFFPLEFQRRLVHDRLDLEVDVVPGGHLIALSQPAALVHYLSGHFLSDH